MDQRRVGRDCVAAQRAQVVSVRRSQAMDPPLKSAKSVAAARLRVRALATASRRCAALRSRPGKTCAPYPRNFDAGHREQFADHSEGRAFQPQFSDAVAMWQQRCKSLRRNASEIAHGFSEAPRWRISGGCVAHDAPPRCALRRPDQTSVRGSASHNSKCMGDPSRGGLFLMRHSSHRPRSLWRSRWSNVNAGLRYECG